MDPKILFIITSSVKSQKLLKRTEFQTFQQLVGLFDTVTSINNFAPNQDILICEMGENWTEEYHTLLNNFNNVTIQNYNKDNNIIQHNRHRLVEYVNGIVKNDKIIKKVRDGKLRIRLKSVDIPGLGKIDENYVQKISLQYAYFLKNIYIKALCQTYTLNDLFKKNLLKDYDYVIVMNRGYSLSPFFNVKNVIKENKIVFKQYKNFYYSNKIPLIRDYIGDKNEAYISNFWSFDTNIVEKLSTQFNDLYNQMIKNCREFYLPSLEHHLYKYIDKELIHKVDKLDIISKQQKEII